MEITKPTLFVDKEKCLINIRKMMEKTRRSEVTLRPHFKTHQSVEIGEWFRQEGVTSCTVSSISMATYFADAGWGDMTVAFPYNPLEAEAVSRLEMQTSLNLLIESEESLKMLNETEGSTGYFVKIDVGTHRTGIDPENLNLISKLIHRSNNHVEFKGFLAHAGHTYKCRDQGSVQRIYHDSIKTLLKLKETFGGLLSYGDTPSCSMVSDFSALDEIRPGNFVFYDWMQRQIGSCKLDDISVCMASPVVTIHRARNEVVVYNGGVHLSKESIIEGGKACFGKAVPFEKGSWEPEIIGNVRSLSQEHGIIEMSDEYIAHIKVGDLIGVIPVHSCMTVDLQGHLQTTTGDRLEKLNKE